MAFMQGIQTILRNAPRIARAGREFLTSRRNAPGPRGTPRNVTPQPSGAVNTPAGIQAPRSNPLLENVRRNQQVVPTPAPGVQNASAATNTARNNFANFGTGVLNAGRQFVTRGAGLGPGLLLATTDVGAGSDIPIEQQPGIQNGTFPGAAPFTPPVGAEAAVVPVAGGGGGPVIADTPARGAGEADAPRGPTGLTDAEFFNTPGFGGGGASNLGPGTTVNAGPGSNITIPDDNPEALARVQRGIEARQGQGSLDVLTPEEAARVSASRVASDLRAAELIRSNRINAPREETFISASGNVETRQTDPLRNRLIDGDISRAQFDFLNSPEGLQARQALQAEDAARVARVGDQNQALGIQNTEPAIDPETAIRLGFEGRRVDLSEDEAERRGARDEREFLTDTIEDPAERRAAIAQLEGVRTTGARGTTGSQLDVINRGLTAGEAAAQAERRGLLPQFGKPGTFTGTVSDIANFFDDIGPVAAIKSVFDRFDVGEPAKNATDLVGQLEKLQKEFGPNGRTEIEDLGTTEAQEVRDALSQISVLKARIAADKARQQRSGIQN